MFDWFKKKELLKIVELEERIALLEARLSDAIKIANGKRVVKCDNKRCIDWKDGTCELPEVKLILGSKGIVRCAEITESIEADMKEDAPVRFVVNSAD